MDFKNTENLKTGARRYFIDNKRVSAIEYYKNEVQCKFKKMNYACLNFYTTKTCQVTSFYYY